MKRKKIEKILKNNLYVALDGLADKQGEYQQAYYKGAKESIISIMETFEMTYWKYYAKWRKNRDK